MLICIDLLAHSGISWLGSECRKRRNCISWRISPFFETLLFKVNKDPVKTAKIDRAIIRDNFKAVVQN